MLSKSFLGYFSCRILTTTLVKLLHQLPLGMDPLCGGWGVEFFVMRCCRARAPWFKGFGLWKCPTSPCMCNKVAWWRLLKGLVFVTDTFWGARWSAKFSTNKSVLRKILYLLSTHEHHLHCHFHVGSPFVLTATRGIYWENAHFAFFASRPNLISATVSTSTSESTLTCSS